VEPSKGASDPAGFLDSKNLSSEFRTSSENQKLADSGRAEVRGISKAQRKLVKEQTRGSISQLLN